MNKVLIYVIKPLVLSINDIVDNWYCTKKTEEDTSNPSVIICFRTETNTAIVILEDLNKLLNKKKRMIGWTGKYSEKDPAVLGDDGFNNFDNIQIVCTFALKSIDKTEEEIKENFIALVLKMFPFVNVFAIHHFANIVGCYDKDLYEYCFEILGVVMKDICSKTWEK